MQESAKSTRLAGRTWLMVKTRMGFGFLVQGFHCDLRFANHQDAASAQSKDRRRAGKYRKRGGTVKSNDVAIESLDRTTHGDKRGRSK